MSKNKGTRRTGKGMGSVGIDLGEAASVATIWAYDKVMETFTGLRRKRTSTAVKSVASEDF